MALPAGTQLGRYTVLKPLVTGGMAEALSELEGPVLAHCAAGPRSAAAWAGAASRYQPVEDVLAALRRAGFNLEPLREELDAQHAGGKDGPVPPALDARSGAA